MATLDQLRKAFGGQSDAETIKLAADSLGMSPMDIAEEVGVPTGRKRGAFMAGLSSGVDDLQGLGYSAGAAVADTLGMRGARDWLNQRADSNQVESMLNGRPDLERVEDVYNQPGKYLPYAAYQIGKQVPQIGGAIAAGALVPEVAVPAALSRGAALLPRAMGGGGMSARLAEAGAVGGSEYAARRAALEAGQTFGRQVVGGGAFNYGQGVGSLYQAQADGGDPNGGVAALAGGVPYALTETLPEAMLVGRVMHGGGFAGSLPTRVGKAGLTQGAAGAASELAQNEMEMAYQGNVSGDQAFSRRLNSGVAGGLVEGILGLPGGVRGRRVRTLDQGPTDLLAGRAPLELSSYGPEDGPALVPNPDQTTPRTALRMPGQYDIFNPDGTPTYASDPSFSDTNPLRPFSPEFSTSPGAAPSYGQGLPFERDIDTSALAIAARRSDPDGIPFEQVGVEPELSLAPQGALQQRGGIPFTPDISTRGLSLTPRLDDGRTIDLFTGQPTATPAAPNEQLELTHPDAAAANQLELGLQQAPPPTGPALPQVGQRGVTSQLPFAGNTTSPKGQVLQGLVESLAEEGHLDDGSKQQVSTLIARGRFGEAKKILDVAIKEKTAADSLVEKVGKLKEKEDANRPGAAEQRAGGAGAGGRVQRDGSQRNAAGVQSVGSDAPGAAPRGGETAPAVPADQQRSSALEGVTSEVLVETADGAKDIHEYETALDELYVRWRDEGDEIAAQYFESNAKVPGFSADLSRVRERAGESATVPQKPDLKKLGSEGKRGLKLGRHPQGDLTAEAKDTDFLLRGLATPKFMRDRRENTPQRTARIEAFLAPIIGKWENKPHLVVVDSMDDERVPAAVRNENASQEAGQVQEMKSEVADTPVAVFYKGKMYVFADAVRDSRDAVTAVFHEGLGHYGLRGVFGKALVPALNALAKARPDLLRAKAREYGFNLEDQIQRLQAADEVLAELAQTRPNLTWVQQAIAAIKTWLREHVPLFANMQVSDSEIIRDYVIPARNWVERGASLADSQVERVTDYNLDDKPQFQRAPNSEAEDRVANGFAEFPYAKSTLGQKIQDALFNMRESPWALKWVTNDQIAEGFKHLKPVQEINRATSRMGAVANRYLETASQTGKKWRALSDSTQLSMQKVMLRSTMDEMHVSVKTDGKHLGVDEAWKHSSNDHLERDKPAVKEAFYSLYREFHALPAPAKAVYDQVRDDLTRQHADTLRALRKSVADHYAGQLKRSLTDDELLALATSDAGVKSVFKDTMELTGTAAELRALDNLYNALRDLSKDFGTVRGPYFPLVRFGDQVVVMKSKDLVDQEMEAQAVRLELQQAMDSAPAHADPASEAHAAKVAELRDRYNRMLEKIQAAKQDEKKYVVEFHESPAQAERARMALATRYPGADVYRSVREQYYRALDGASPSFLNDLTDSLAAALDAGDGVSAEAKSSAVQAMKDMYLRRQPERSALRSELKRMTVEGVQSGQMLRGYAQAARNGAWRISRLLHAGEVTTGLAQLSEDRRNADAKHVLNELKARFVGDIAPPDDNKWLQRLGNATYFMHLGFNISYFVTNSTQAWAISLPVMGGRHGIVNSANSLMGASKDVIHLLSQATSKSIEENGTVVGLQLRLTDDQIASLAKDAGEAAMLKTLTDEGVIDITIKHDLGAISDGTTKSIPGRIMEISSAMANFPELYNRLTTALAAYRMESARREGGAETEAQVQERAQAYAENIINRTHFNYSPENAPRMMRGQLGRLVFQFKRYQQGMIYLFAKLIRDSSNGDADARRSLAYLLGATTAIGGVAALPVAAPIALAAKVLASVYPDDDEPDWLQQWYNGMKDGIGETAAQALVKGLPTVAGLDLSKKLGQGDLLNPVAFANTDGKKFFSRDYFTEVGFSLMGPGAAVLGNEAEAVGAAKSGDFLKAAEKGMPTFLANVLKAYHRADAGLTTKAGDTIMEPEEFSALSVAAKAMGFESVKVSDTYDQRSSYMQSLQGRKEARQGLLRQYYEAVKSGDNQAMDQARDAILAFNERQPSDPVRSRDLASSIKQHSQRAMETKGGLQVGRRDQDTFRRLTGE